MAGPAIDVTNYTTNNAYDNLEWAMVMDAEQEAAMETSATNATDSGHNSTMLTEEDEVWIYHASSAEYIVPRIAAMISLLGVICVAIESYKDLRTHTRNRRSSSVMGGGHTTGNMMSTTRWNNTLAVTRIQFFYQIPLFCHALSFALGMTVAPQGMDIWGAIGTTATCDIQGFLMQFALHANFGWDAALSWAFLMMVRYYNYSGLPSWEKYYHLVIWPVALAMSIYPLLHGMYNPNHTVCWLESLPPDCKGDECYRGEGAGKWGGAASTVAMVHLLYSITVMICIYCSIRQIENRAVAQKQRHSSVHRHPPNQQAQRRSGSGDRISPSSRSEEEEESKHYDDCEEATSHNTPTHNNGSGGEQTQGSGLSPVHNHNHNHHAASASHAHHGSSRDPTSRTSVTSNAANSNNNNNKRRISRAVANQGMLYTAGMVLTTLPISLYIVIYDMTGFSNDGLRTFATSTLPLLGYVNFVVFMRRRSVEDCHTSYAKYLRRAHSWMWDRTPSSSSSSLWTCHCHKVVVACCPLPQRRSRTDFRQNPNSAPTPPGPATAAIPVAAAGGIAAAAEDHRQPPVKRPFSYGPSGGLQLSVIDEYQTDEYPPAGDDTFTTDKPNEDSGYSKGPWSGFFIRLAQRTVGKGVESSIVSDIGCSSVEDSHYDHSPSLPVRLQSEAEPQQQQQRPVQPRKQAPVQPRRVLSEVDEEDDLEMAGSSRRPATRSFVSMNSDLPPGQPQRIQSCTIESEVEDITPDITVEWRGPASSQATIRSQATIPSCKSVATCFSDIPPGQPQRIQSCVSSDDSTSRVDDEEDTELYPPSPVQTRNSSFATITSEAPPSKPVRVQSVVETEEEEEEDDYDDDDHRRRSHNHGPWMDSSGRSSMNGSHTLPPTMPLRFLSELSTIASSHQGSSSTFSPSGSSSNRLALDGSSGRYGLDGSSGRYSSSQLSSVRRSD